MAGTARSTKVTRVMVETGKSKVFAAALDWPGWARGAAKRGGPEAALEALDDHRDRYAAVAAVAGVGFRPSRTYEVVQTVDGDATTDFVRPDRCRCVQALRNDVCAVLLAARDGGPLEPKGWTARYAVRRMAWHVLDHVWEIEDKSEG